jgi:hypothetical protein
VVNPLSRAQRPASHHAQRVPAALPSSSRKSAPQAGRTNRVA